MHFEVETASNIYVYFYHLANAVNKTIMDIIKSYIRPKTSSKASKPGSAPPLVPETMSSIPQPRNSVLDFTTSHSLHPSGDFRNNTQEQINDIKSDIAINWVYNMQNKRMWSSGSVGEGVVLRRAYKAFASCPAELSFSTGGLFDAACELNAKVGLQLLDVCTILL